MSRRLMWECLVTPDPDTSAKASSYKWEVYVIQIGGVWILLPTRRRIYFYNSTMMQFGAVPRHFSKVSRSGVAATFLIQRCFQSQQLLIIGLLCPPLIILHIIFIGRSRSASATWRNCLDNYLVILVGSLFAFISLESVSVIKTFFIPEYKSVCNNLCGC